MSSDEEAASERADSYVLGLLDASDSAMLEVEMETNSALRAAVAESRDRFLELDLIGSEQPVSPDLWSRIDTSLGKADVASSGDQPRQEPGNDNRLGRWQKTAYAAIAASLVLATALTYTLVGTSRPQVIAVLMDEKGVPLVLVEDFGNTSARITPLADFSVPAGRSMQVWTLPNKDIGPTSLGLLDGWRTATLDSRGLPAPHEEQLYEITLEQPGGSPTGRPTGPILVKGFGKVPR